MRSIMNENINNNVCEQDAGEKYAKNSLLFGAMSLFVFPTVFSILGIVDYARYKKIGNGSNRSQATAGLVLSLSSIVLQIVLIIMGIFVIKFLISFGDGMNSVNFNDLIIPFQPLIDPLREVG